MFTGNTVYNVSTKFHPNTFISLAPLHKQHCRGNAVVNDDLIWALCLRKSRKKSRKKEYSKSINRERIQYSTRHDPEVRKLSPHCPEVRISQLRLFAI